MKFKSVFIAIFVSTSLILAALLIQSKRPMVDLAQPSADFVRATGKCAECHRQETSSIIHQFEISRHAQVGLNCLDCHQSLDGQEKQNHRGFVISGKVTSNNYRVCHSTPIPPNTINLCGVVMGRRLGRPCMVGRISRRSKSFNRKNFIGARLIVRPINWLFLKEKARCK